jgi:hypothetical protein
MTTSITRGSRRVAEALGCETRLMRSTEIGSVYGAKQFWAAGARDLRQIAGFALKATLGEPGKCGCLDPVRMQTVRFG